MSVLMFGGKADNNQMVTPMKNKFDMKRLSDFDRALIGKLVDNNALDNLEGKNSFTPAVTN